MGAKAVMQNIGKKGNTASPQLLECRKKAAEVAEQVAGAQWRADQAAEKNPLPMPCDEEVTSVLLEMEAGHGSQLRTTNGRSQIRAWALRAKAAARAGQRATWSSDMTNPMKIQCDTAYKCKKQVALKQKRTCVICPDQLYIPTYSTYGADEFTKKSPFGRFNQAMERVQYRHVDPYEVDGKVWTGNAKKSNGVACPPPSEDSFKLPCCVPKQNPITGALVIAGKALLAMRDMQGQAKGSDFLQVGAHAIHSRTLNRHRLLRRARGAAAKSREKFPIPYIPGIDGNRGDNKYLGITCCGGGPSCCRWCPEQLCEKLEISDEVLEPLWWHVCSNTDVNPGWDDASPLTLA